MRTRKTTTKTNISARDTKYCANTKYIFSFILYLSKNKKYKFNIYRDGLEGGGWNGGRSWLRASSKVSALLDYNLICNLCPPQLVLFMFHNSLSSFCLKAEDGDRALTGPGPTSTAPFVSESDASYSSGFSFYSGWKTGKSQKVHSMNV